MRIREELFMGMFLGNFTFENMTFDNIVGEWPRRGNCDKRNKD